MRHPALPPLTLAVASLLATPALAADADETVMVLGKTYRNTATKTRLTPLETPQAISVVDRETLSLRAVRSVSESLRYLPGVNTELRGGAVSRLDLFNIRGFDNYQNSYDGLLLQYNGWNLQPQIDPIALEQVEVFKGPTSVLYGSMPPGGMVNLIAKAPRREAATELSVASGSHALREASIDSTGPLGQSPLTYRLVGLARKQEGQAVTSTQERYLIAPSLDWQLGERTLLNLNLYYQKDPAMGIYTTVPASGSVHGNPHGQLASDAFLGDRNWNHYEREVTLLGYKLNHDFGNGWQFLQNTRYTDASAQQRNTYNAPLAADQRTVARNAYLTDEVSHGLVIDNQLSARLDVGRWQHHLLLGLDAQRLNADVRYLDTLDYSAPAIDLFTPDHDQIDPAALGFNYQDDEAIRQRQTGLYLQDQVRWERWVLIAGGRYDTYRSDTDSRTLYQGAPGQSHGRISQHNTSWRVGALYELPSGLAPYLNYAESFEPVAGIDKNGNGFKPSTGQQWESGVKYLSADGGASATLSAFHITKKNSLVTDPDNLYGPKLQTGETVSRGIELEGRWALSDALDVSASYTLLDMEITRDTTGLKGKTPVWVPEQTASLWADYRIEQGSLSGLTLGSGVRYVGKTEIDAQNSGKVPGYTLWDMAARYDLGRLGLRGTEAVLSASNLLDKAYLSCYDTGNCWFGAERNIEARLNYRF